MLWSCLNIKEISHICEEGGSHPRISLWHLMMTLKNNYLLKKLLKWANKQCKNFNIYNVVFFYKKKWKKNTWRYYYFTHVYQKSRWYDLQFLRYMACQTSIGDTGLFFNLPFPLRLLKTRKIRIKKKNEKNCWRYHFTHVYQKPQSYDLWLLKYGVRRRELLSFWVILANT